ncbi:aliphatic sulfonates ABC transporter permease [Myxococcus stipitatus DSM 14675]|uniref:Aliphatic sulfonates ABC transporter permease n=1 Tax=Myxococcus stipitatus (strain DSM 14675 / JCM 12634 / Mx s8) TaxID=1278073 RepID=L7UAG8_MYXSD|nr:ABC transporter permease [Myxococcus stipitatus]AGC44602.1 aliphatic sulfonates ABC transporter permease [Myxococcus stipitatus DSM 14675]
MPTTSDPGPLARRSAESLLLPAVTLLLLLAGWVLAVRATGTKVFPHPMQVLDGMLELMRSGVLLRYAADSLLRVGLGFGLAVLVGLVLGMGMGLYPMVALALGPVVQFLRPISPLAWVPIAILFFGVGDKAAVALIFLAASLPLALHTTGAMATVPAIYLNAGRNFGLSPLRLFFRVLLPAAMPQLLVGLRIALWVSWQVVVAAEMIAVDSGLGYMIVDARNAGKRYDLVVAGMLLIGGIGLLLDTGIRKMESLRWVRWGFREE